ncbi:unnamed protein product, partial [Brenthis ino]
MNFIGHMFTKRRKMDEKYQQPGSSRFRNYAPRGNRHQSKAGSNNLNNNKRKESQFNIQAQPSFVHPSGNTDSGAQPSPRNIKNVRSRRPTGHRTNEDQSQNYRNKMGFLMLEQLANSDTKDILTNLNQKKVAFFNLLESPIDRPDVFILIMNLISKICNSSFDQIKLKFLLEISNSPFIAYLRNYLMDLPYAENKATNKLYWKNETEFWKNFITFCECITLVSPSTALNKCRSLIEASSKCCLDGLKDRHNFELPEAEQYKLTKLRETLKACEEEKNNVEKQNRKRPNANEEHEPPENFRELSIIPRREDLINTQPFLRANIVKGCYRDVEHYLDVQFRLLREDCFGPLRDGIIQYIQHPTKHKYDNIRVFRNVTFVGPYVSKQKIGSIIELDESTKKKFKKIRWSHNKRFIFGSLVLLTKDNCNSFIVGTILDRDEKYLNDGKIPISIVDIVIGEELYNGDRYTMIESDVYYEPYHHVLKALQDPTFPQHIAMKKYIVDVDPEPTYPSYVNEDTIFRTDRLSLDLLHEPVSFTVKDLTTWPTSNELELNDSQYEAYKTALTHEFAVIQGPPGTGKTYLGVKVAKTLLESISRVGCTLLLVCYTNHALDQFLEEISKKTNSIVRIGGQSKNEVMEKYNLNTLRKNNVLPRATSRLYMEERQNLRNLVLQLQRAQEQMDSILHYILSYSCMKRYVPQLSEIADKYKRIIQSGKDPLCYWLFEYLEYDLDEPILLDQSQNVENVENINLNIDDDGDNQAPVLLDDLEINFDEDVEGDYTEAFSIKEAEGKLKRLIPCYIRSNDPKEKHDLRLEIAVLRGRIRLFNQMKSLYLLEHREYPANIENFSNLPQVDRWMLYFSWTKFVINGLKDEIKPLKEALATANSAYEEARMIMDIELLKNIKVVGMTTSGAARLRKLLQALAPPIVIVEEAAEVLEQHIVTSLTKNCQHVILIGDHQQLRPSAAYMRLAKAFNIEVSLFERMIMNSMHSRRLAVQHRMRPQIAALISPHIYPDLINHPSVNHFPDVRGITANLFFFTHTYKEEYVEDGTSKTNQKEGDLILRLANYIMQQGYEPEDVTILAAYSGQMFYMRKERPNYAFLSKVKITVVDNYQGEESKIILLSLVRNNDQNKIGFLGTPNRICVALSRAREGFYIFGNIDMLKKNSELWTKIAGTLENQGALGSSIRLKCENHAGQITNISSSVDFEKVPEGGCLLKCNYTLPCLHLCPLVCHGYDRGHSKYKCPFKCERIICDLSHVCPLKCHEACKPCRRLVEKKLPCGHKKNVFCHLDPDSATITCLTLVSAKLPSCGHEIKKPCYVDMNKVSCPVPCEFRVERCGHMCVRKCHVNDDPDHEKYLCQKPCIKRKNKCTANAEDELGNHQCNKRCYETCDDCNVQVIKKRESCKHKERVACSENPDKKPCLKKCARKLAECEHFCKKKCFETCGDCNEKVVKKIPECGHEIKVECRIQATKALCAKMCERTLSCGHPCRQPCNQPCDEKKCTELIPNLFDSPCGHKVKLPCNAHSANSQRLLKPLEVMQHCRAACGAELACGHACAGDCARCRRGRLHAPCTRRCSQINICGHDCEEPCSQVCPPCKKKCEIQCEHSRCPRSCGAPCIPCQEPCTRACRHGRCSRRCGQPCSVAACRAPCAARLACGHACRGLCGERCPDICNVCRPEQFPTDFLGDQFDDDALFVVLKDCGHVMEFETLETLMNSESESISLRACPTCRKPIINTHRYKDKVNEQFKTDINPIKERVFGTEKQIAATKLQLTEKILSLRKTAIYKDILFSDWKKAHDKIFPYTNIKRKNSLLQLNLYFIYLDILELLSEVYNKFTSAKLNELQTDLIEENSVICKVLINNVQKLSQQQQEDISNEIKRMNSIVQFSKILSHPTYIINKTNADVQKAMQTAHQAILGWGKFNEDIAVESLKNMQKVVKLTGIITKQEIDLIIRAIGAKAGSWYKCPNGHFYHIDRCGGAMEVGKCNECKASIGGRNHTLLSSNRHAPEIDNSRYAAWSQEANNMANFDLDNLL